MSRYFPTYTPQYIQAIDELKKANELNPDCFEVLYGLAQAHQKLMLFDVSNQFYKKASKQIQYFEYNYTRNMANVIYMLKKNLQNPHNSNDTLDSMDWPFYSNWGTLMFEMNRYEEGNTRFQSANVLSPNNWEIISAWGKAIYNTEYVGFAYQLFEIALELSPDDPRFYMEWAEIVSSDDYEDNKTAIKLYEKASKMLPGEYRIYCNWANTLSMVKDFQGAIKVINKAIEIEKTDYLSYVLRGECFFHLRDYKAAIQNFEVAYKLKGSELNAEYFICVLMGQSLFRTGDIKQADKCFKKAIQYGPARWETFLTWGDELEELKKYDAAFDVYSTAISQFERSTDIDDSDRAMLYEFHGFCAKEIKEYVVALESYSKSHALDPTNSLENSISFLKGIIEGRMDVNDTIKLALAQKEHDEIRLKHFNPNSPNQATTPKNIFKNLDINWNQVSIELVSDDAIVVKAPGFETKRFNYTDLGMRDGRRGDMPTKIWDIIKLLANQNGKITTKEMGFNNRGRIEKTISRLRKKLETAFGIDENSILFNKKGKSFRTVFKITDIRPATVSERNMDNTLTKI